jgi:hypothetical protein
MGKGWIMGKQASAMVLLLWWREGLEEEGDEVFVL